MAANVQPIFPLVPKAWPAVVSTANANRDGTTGTYVTLCSGGDNGARLDRVTVTARGTTLKGLVRFFVTVGESTVLLHEEPIAALVPTGTTRAVSAEWSRTDGNPVALLGPGDTITCSSSVTQSAGVSIVATGGTY